MESTAATTHLSTPTCDPTRTPNTYSQPSLSPLYPPAHHDVRQHQVRRSLPSPRVHQRARCPPGCFWYWRCQPLSVRYWHCQCLRFVVPPHLDALPVLSARSSSLVDPTDTAAAGSSVTAPSGTDASTATGIATASTPAASTGTGISAPAAGSGTSSGVLGGASGAGGSGTLAPSATLGGSNTTSAATGSPSGNSTDGNGAVALNAGSLGLVGVLAAVGLAL